MTVVLAFLLGVLAGGLLAAIVWASLDRTVVRRPGYLPVPPKEPGRG